jgi:hypothetical protein
MNLAKKILLLGIGKLGHGHFDTFLSLVVSICLDVISIETLDLDICKTMSRLSSLKNDISTNLDEVYALKSDY